MNWLPRRQRAIRARLVQAVVILLGTTAFLTFIWIGLYIAAEKGW